MIERIRTYWSEIGPFQSLYTDECLETVRNWSGLMAKPHHDNRRRGGIRVFRNGFIEQVLSKAHPASPAIWVVPLVTFGVYRGITTGPGGLRGTLLLFGLGVLLWTLIEYLLHRHVFHLNATSPAGRLRSFMAHGYHHEFPDDKMRLVAPPLMSWTFGVIAGLLYFLVLGEGLWLQVFVGTVAGYLAYDWIHYYTHHFHPRNPVGRWVQRYHLKHHFQGGDARFGISSPLWDYVFHTYRSP
jgi:sterol desaturase/sphingolipid hydroxylase (fatty acid hydroxylase superfamily)